MNKMKFQPKGAKKAKPDTEAQNLFTGSFDKAKQRGATQIAKDKQLK